jgi:hypothetical protein
VYICIQFIASYFNKFSVFFFYKWRGNLTDEIVWFLFLSVWDILALYLLYKPSCHIYKTKDRVTRTSLKTGGELRCSEKINRYCSTSDNRGVNLFTLCSCNNVQKFGSEDNNFAGNCMQLGLYSRYKARISHTDKNNLLDQGELSFGNLHFPDQI